MAGTFRCLMVEQADGGVTRSLKHVTIGDLHEGDVTIRVAYSSLNYKDSLATRADGRVARRYPLIPGIDLAGTVVESGDPRFAAGDTVLAHGYDIGVSHHGGFAEMARLPAGWVVPMPAGLSPRDAMAIGTAGFTAALSVDRLEHMGLQPGAGPVLVAGASGGVGSIAVSILASHGYHVVASTGSPDAHAYLRELGAAEIIDRAETSGASDRPLEKARWAGAVDPVGGATLAYMLRTMNTGGSIASSGNTGGAAVNTTVFPFILRGVSVLGIDSVAMPIERRVRLWNRLASDLRPPHLDRIVEREVTLDGLPEVLDAIHAGRTRGRVIVRLGE